MSAMRSLTDRTYRFFVFAFIDLPFFAIYHHFTHFRHVSPDRSRQ
jgi:hypothetical protein